MPAPLQRRATASAAAMRFMGSALLSRSSSGPSSAPRGRVEGSQYGHRDRDCGGLASLADQAVTTVAALHLLVVLDPNRVSLGDWEPEHAHEGYEGRVGGRGCPCRLYEGAELQPVQLERLGFVLTFPRT